MTKEEMFFQAGLYTLIGLLTPILAILATGAEITNRLIGTMIIAALISGAAACKAFLSTTFADEQVTEGKTLKPSIKRKS